MREPIQGTDPETLRRALKERWTIDPAKRRKIARQLRRAAIDRRRQEHDPDDDVDDELESYR
jgi:hypothetical protein